MNRAPDGGGTSLARRRNGSVENRFPGELPGYYIELAGRRDRGSRANGVARRNMLVSRERTLTNTSDYTDISVVYLIRAIATASQIYARAYVAFFGKKLPYRDKSQSTRVISALYFSREKKKYMGTHVTAHHGYRRYQCRADL